MKSLLLLAPLAACSMSNSPSPSPTGDNGVVPLEVHHLSSGGVRFGAWVQIGTGAPFRALVDTGSSGLRVLPGAVDDGAYASISDELVAFSYHSGLALQGVVATGTVTIGGLTTPQPIPIMRVRTVGCTPEVPACADANAFGYQAVLGIGMRNLDTSGGIGNPIAQLEGAPSYVVRAPAFGGDRGELDIAPADADVARFATVALPPLAAGAPLATGVGAWDDRRVPACVTDETRATPFCAGALLDTGSMQTSLEWPSYAGDPRTWASGTAVQVSIGEPDALIASYGFTVGAPPVPGVDKVVSETRTNATANLINLGTAPFLRYDVWFDQRSGRVGVAPRAAHPPGDCVDAGADDQLDAGYDPDAPDASLPGFDGGVVIDDDASLGERRR